MKKGQKVKYQKIKYHQIWNFLVLKSTVILIDHRNKYTVINDYSYTHYL